jgi:transcriptional regulator with XRE-family HTH domain
MSNLGEKIKQIRIARGFTQDDIAEAMNLKRTTVSNWEKNLRVPSSDKLIEYAKVVGVTLDYFGDNSPERTLFQTMAQLDQLFMDASVPEADKDKAYQDIMKVYLKSKEITGVHADLEEIQIHHDKNLPEAKEE